MKVYIVCRSWADGYEDEEEVDGDWFNSVDEAIDFVNEFKGSL